MNVTLSLSNNLNAQEYRDFNELLILYEQIKTESDTRMTASFLKQDSNTYRFEKNAYLL